MILQEEVTVIGFAEMRVDVEFACRDEGSEGRGIAIVFEDFDTVQPVLSMCSADDDAGGVPLANRPDRLRTCCGNEVVKGRHSAVAIATFFGVGVKCIVQDLVFKADVGTVATMARSESRIDEVLDTGICTRRNAEIDRELKVGVFARTEDIAGVAPFFATVLSDGEESVFNLPSAGGKIRTVGAVPACGCPSIEEEPPALGLFLRCESVGDLRERGPGSKKDCRYEARQE